MSSVIPEYVSSPPGRASRARYGVIAFIVALAMVTYLDRACISTVAGDIRKDFSLSEQQMANVFASFAIAYAIFEIPTAWWAQRRGTRRVLTRIVLWWSALTMLTAAVPTPNALAHIFPAITHAFAWSASFFLMLAVRFLFGMGEAGAWPCAAASYARWIPERERGFAQGMLFAGAHISGGLTPFLVIFLLESAHIHWRVIFLLFGSVGFFWAIGWHLWFRDDPADHPRVNDAELQAIVASRGPPPEHDGGWPYWKRILANRNIVPLCLMYIGNSYAYFFCITWLPTYIKEKHHLASTALGIAAGLPLTVSVLGDIFGGLTTDSLCKRFGTRVGRSGLGAVMYSLATLGILLAVSTNSPWLAIGALSFAVACVMFTLGAAWGVVIEIGGHHTGMIGAIMNTAGNTASIFSPIVAILVKDNLPGGWNAPLYVIGVLFAVGAVSWCFIDARHRVFD